MTNKERQAKISEAVSQIGRLVGACAKHGLTQDDIMTMIQTSTSLVCEINDVPLDIYVTRLRDLHERRTARPV